MPASPGCARPRVCRWRLFGGVVLYSLGLGVGKGLREVR